MVAIFRTVCGIRAEQIVQAASSMQITCVIVVGPYESQHLYGRERMYIADTTMQPAW